jgi:hypothetical protein
MTVLDGPPPAAAAAKTSRLDLITGVIVLSALSIVTLVVVRFFFY